MDFLKVQLQRIREQLGGLTNSQRIAIGLSLALALAGAYGMINWAGSARWTPVLDQPLTPEQIRRISTALLAAQIEVREDVDRVLIKGDANARRRAQAVLAQSDALPRDTSMSYQKLISEQSPFTSRRRAQWRELRGLESELARTLRDFTGVKEARVLLTKAERRSYLSRGQRSSAAVNLTMEGDRGISKKLVTSIAHFVAGAVGLKVQEVTITDGLRFYRPPGEEEAVPANFIDIQRAHEDLTAKKIYDQLRNIAGVVVNVHATLRTEDEQTNVTTLDEPKIIEDTKDDEERKGGGDAVGPGIRPNVGFAQSNAGPSMSETKEKAVTKYDPNRGGTTQITNRPPGHLERLTATVSVPRSYLERIIRARPERDDTQPVDDEEIELAADFRLPKIKTQVMTLLDAGDASQVVVDWHYDPTPDGQAALAESVPLDYLAMAREFGPQAGLGLLALISLLAVMRMAKRAHATLVPAAGSAAAAAGAGPGGPGIPMVGEAGELITLGGGPIAVGEAEEVDGVLEGREVDEDALRSQQIVKQIGLLVKEDSQAAASLLERWIGHGN